jgi:hypothetical protein
MTQGYGTSLETVAATPRPVGLGIPFTTIFFVFILILFWVIQGFGAIERAWEHDFLNIYTGSTLARQGRFAELHARDAQRQVQQRLVPSVEELVPFVRPHFYALALAPLSSLSYRQAFWLWIGGNFALLLGCWAWAAHRFGSDALIFGALFFPTAAGISNGQDCVLMLIIAIAAFCLAERERWFLSGLVLGLGLMKFHLLLLAPLAMLLQRRFRMTAGFCLTGALAALVSLALGGWSGARSYVDLLLSKDLPRLSPAPERMVNIHSLPANFGIDQTALTALLFAGVAAVMIVAVRRAPLWRWFSLMLAASTLAVPHVYAYDQSMLLLPVWLALFLSRDPVTRIAAMLMAAPLAFYGLSIGPPWSAAPALVSLFFFLALARESWQDNPASTLAPAPPRNHLASS